MAANNQPYLKVICICEWGNNIWLSGSSLVSDVIASKPFVSILNRSENATNDSDVPQLVSELLMNTSLEYLNLQTYYFSVARFFFMTAVFDTSSLLQI